MKEAAPLPSTPFVIAAGEARASSVRLVPAGLIAGGAALAAAGSGRRPGRSGADQTDA